MASADVLAPMATSAAIISPAQASAPRTKKRVAAEPLLDNKNIMPATEAVTFDAGKHLKYTPPSRIRSMKELGLPEDCGISPVAVSEPFPLFSEEAIQQMRKEVLSEPVWEHCQYSSNLAHCQLRGFASE